MGKTFNLIDLFAGAGGFSEGFLQAEENGKTYNFLLASDINENCELTHVVRYNVQLGLKTKFLRKDITDRDFIHKIKDKIGNEEVDVICGGPPCQSFSLAGRRRTFDKKDDLFMHYLNVVREFKPKYFVMENVKGILTKYEGNVVERIKREISEILDSERVATLTDEIKNFASSTKVLTQEEKEELNLTIVLLNNLALEHGAKTKNIQKYFSALTREFTSGLPKFANYHISKTDVNINTVRHGLKILESASEWDSLSLQVMKLKSRSDIDNDNFVSNIDEFLREIEPESILNKMQQALTEIKDKGHLSTFKRHLELYEYCVEEYIEIIKGYVGKDLKNKHAQLIAGILENGLNLYNLNGPMVLLASDYGVPQNRERVIFLGSRNDQREIAQITKTTARKEDKVSIFEAIYDLDNIGINETVYGYDELLKDAKDYVKEHKHLLKYRSADGVEMSKNKGGKTFAEWSKEGRLLPRYKVKKSLFCSNYNDFVSEEERSNLEYNEADLFNHQTSNHNADVQKRLEIIRRSGDYKFAAVALKSNDVLSKKRNYNVFLPSEQATTIMTIADDYIHYRANRAPTVREMARLQSFDDSFVFQGKRTTGGDRRKDETPQFTMVGNAVPPLMARAIALEILRSIS